MWLFLALLCPAEAETLDKVHGWTADGAFAWEVTDAVSWEEPDTGQRGAGSYKVRLGIVRTPDGERRHFLLERATTGSGTYDRPDLGSETEWKAWLGAHPTRGTASRTVGSRRLDVVPEGAVEGKHGWQGATYAFPKEHQTYSVWLGRGEQREELQDGEVSEERLDRIRALPKELTAALTEIRQVSTLSDDDLKPLLAAVENDSQLAQAQQFVQLGFADGAHAAARRLHDLALASGKTEREARGILTRATPAAHTEEDIREVREAYEMTLAISLGDREVPIQVQTPYHISTRIGISMAPVVQKHYSAKKAKEGDELAQAQKGVGWAKGSPEQVAAVMADLLAKDEGGVTKAAAAKYEAVIKAEGTEEDAAAAVRVYLEQWMADKDVGVDCSGFAMQATAFQDATVAAGWMERTGKDDLMGIALNNSNVSMMNSSANTEEIPVSAARPGDLVINRNHQHVGVIEAPARLVPVSSLPIKARGENLREEAIKKLGIKLEDAEKTMLWEVGIAHSQDKNGQGGSDQPGPHLGRHWYSEAGKRIAYDDPTEASFCSFHRPLLAKPKAERT